MVSGNPASRPPLTGALLATAGVTFAIALSGLGTRATYNARTTADEPQYLLTAISIGEDLDLDIADELAEERFLDFHEVPLNPQTIAVDGSDRRVSPHDPLLPVLLAIPMRIGGWMLARVAMAGLAAATAAATVWLAVRRFDVEVTTASLVGAAMFSAPPLVGYGTQIYPEMAAALATATGVAATTGRPTTRSRIVALGAIVALPWLSVKYAPVAAVIAVALLAPLVRGRRWRPAGLLAAALAGAGLIYLAVHHRVYGGWTVYAAGDHFVDGEFQVVGSDPDYIGRSRRLLGLLVDRGFGLIAWAPAYALLVPGVAVVIRRRPPGWPVPVAVVAAGWAVATWVALTMHGWWLPGRQVVVVLPMAVVAVAVLVDRRPRLRTVALVGSVVGTFNWLWLAVEASTGRRTLVIDFTQTANPLYRIWSTLLPDHRVFDGWDVALTGLWAIALAGSAVLAWRAEPATPTGSPTSTTQPSALAVPQNRLRGGAR